MPSPLATFQNHYANLKQGLVSRPLAKNINPVRTVIPLKVKSIPLPPPKKFAQSNAKYSSGHASISGWPVASGVFNVSGNANFTTGIWHGQSGIMGGRGIWGSLPIKAKQSLDIPDDTASLFQQQIPQDMLSKYTVAGKPIGLKQSHYKASGGEGIVYVKDGQAYKIYHDPKKMIPVGKIQELSVMKMHNVLGPRDIIYLDNTPVGFVMPAVTDSEFLCKLFTKGFRDKNNITPDMINHLVAGMQDTLDTIHGLDILVVDYNEMNFLVNNGFDTVFNIDVDSYKTPSYPATAIMESIRDRKVLNKKFTKNSDWFSFGCVAFQLYTGSHPYKGRHPDYAPKDWMEMMDKGISVFNKKCKLPPACQTLDVIPKGHLKWFEAVFEKGDRLPPPEPDYVQIVVGTVVTKIIDSNDTFNIGLARQYDGQIESLRYIDGICYVITNKSIWGDGKQFTTFAPEVGYVSKRTVKDLVPVHGDKPAVVEYNKIDGKLRYKTFENKEIGVIDSKGFFIANRSVYTVVGSSLIEVSFANRGAKANAMQQAVANIFHNHQIFDGLVVQNMLGTCRFAIPFESGKCQTVHITELDKARIVDARYERGVAIVIAEEGGKYNRHTFIFNKDCSTYTTRTEKDVNLEDINFVVKDNGVVIAANDDKLEIFLDNQKVKMVNSPLNNNEPLVAFKNDTYIINRDAVYKVSSK